MRGYLWTTALLFLALVGIHLWRLTLEPHLVRPDPEVNGGLTQRRRGAANPEVEVSLRLCASA